MPGKIKVNFKMPPETAAEKLDRKFQELRKKRGAPDPEHYKKMAAQKQKEIDAMKNEETEQLDELSSDTLDSYVSKASKSISRHYRTKGINKALTKSLIKSVRKPQNEEVEQLDEMPESSMKTRDVHSHLKKSGWSLTRSSGGHDVYKHPKAKHSIPVPRHKQLKAPLIRGIMKASKVAEETEIDEQLYKKGKFVSGPVKKPYKSPTIVSSIKEAKDTREYDYEGDMAKSQLRSLIFNAEDLIELMDDNTNLPEWVQSKITLAEDYISTAANYLRGELNEAANPAQQAAIAINMKKKGVKPKGMKEEVEQIDEKKGYGESDPLANRADYAKRHGTGQVYKKTHAGDKVGMTKSYAYDIKRSGPKGKLPEEVELSEGRPSQRHPLEGHEYHKKSDEALVHIAKDAHAAAEAMKGHNTAAENKYRDQANDSATVRYYRKKHGMADWYKKKYGHVKEEVEQLDEVGDTKKGQKLLRMVNKRAVDRLVSKRADKDPAYAKKAQQTHLAADERLKEEVEQLDEKNVPTSPEKWAQAKAQAKSKFDVYPSAYANGWAAKKYKEMGGGWKSVNEDTDEPSAAARTLSRKAQIVRDAAKGKKKEQEEASDKFQKDPELSSDMQKT